MFVRGREAMSDELLSVRFDEPLIDELMRFVNRDDVPGAAP
jgi:hypothetical protein